MSARRVFYSYFCATLLCPRGGQLDKQPAPSRLKASIDHIENANVCLRYGSTSSCIFKFNACRSAVDEGFKCLISAFEKSIYLYKYRVYYVLHTLWQSNQKSTEKY
jgi:hypothetical protein